MSQSAGAKGSYLGYSRWNICLRSSKLSRFFEQTVAFKIPQKGQFVRFASTEFVIHFIKGTKPWTLRFILFSKTRIFKLILFGKRFNTPKTLLRRIFALTLFLPIMLAVKIWPYFEYWLIGKQLLCLPTIIFN